LCAAGLLSLAAFGASFARATQVSGRITLRDSHVAAVSKGGDYSGVVVSLVPTGTKPELEPRRATMLQKDKTFTPHVLPISVGSTVDFPNSDPIFHNAFSSYNGQIFDVGLYPPGSTRAVRFRRPGVVRVFCNIHPTMSAVIVVLETPWFTVTRPDGSFSLSVRPGLYRMQVYHERATEATLAALARNLDVTEEAVRIPPVTISESGYIAIPHKNKYGHDYAPDSGDQILYPGARQ
jgi:plastocyanin